MSGKTSKYTTTDPVASRMSAAEPPGAHHPFPSINAATFSKIQAMTPRDPPRFHVNNAGVLECPPLVAQRSTSLFAKLVLFRSLQGVPGFLVTCADPPGGQHRVQQLADGKVLEQRDHASQLFIKLEHWANHPLKGQKHWGWTLARTHFSQKLITSTTSSCIYTYVYTNIYSNRCATTFWNPQCWRDVKQ